MAIFCCYKHIWLLAIFAIIIITKAEASMGKMANLMLQATQSASDECCGENMAYALQMNDSRTIRGRKFNCSLGWLLERYKLSDKHAIKEKIEVKYPGDPKFAIVTATNGYNFFRALIANIKERFGCKQKIIAYDLGNVTKNSEWMIEINSVCALEWRIFDFSQMSDDRVRNSNAWIVFIMAHVLMEYDTVLAVDPRFTFESIKLEPILTPIQKGTIGPVQQLTNSGHGMNSATHPGMYEYLPMFSNFEPNKTYAWTGKDPPQFEDNIFILHKTEQTRQLMKWALLCAAEPDCVVPIGHTTDCVFEQNGLEKISVPRAEPNKTCHRRVQSLINILRYNMEYRQQIEDASFLTHLSPGHPIWSSLYGNPMTYGDHPLWFGTDGIYHTARWQEFNGTKNDWVQKVKCC